MEEQNKPRKIIIYQLHDEYKGFPDPREIPDEQRDPDGLYAVGGDLSPLRLLNAYSLGIFPWFSFRGEQMLWYCPTQRFVIFPDEIHVSHSMRTLLNKRLYSATIDRDFAGVIARCSEQRIDMPGAWLGPDMIAAYTELHRRRYAHSVEVWDADGRLVGGLYGIELNKCFFGESMFSDVPSASKIALIYLARVLRSIGGPMIDCQFETPHLRSMGGRHIPYAAYMRLLHPEPNS